MKAPRVVLLGMKHSGKSTLGRRLANHYGQPFFDVDQLVEAHAKARSGIDETVREVFVRLGAEGFEQIEGEAVREFLGRPLSDDQGYVLALGGRTPLNPSVKPMLTRLGTCVYLDVNAEQLWTRVKKGGVPPFLDPKRPREDFMALCADRAPYYRLAADLTVTLDALAPAEDNTLRVRNALKEL